MGNIKCAVILMPPKPVKMTQACHFDALPDDESQHG